MSYIVLARKWRPKRFEDVVGQEHITTTLLNSMRSSRTAHAYLFVGPRGIGKTSTARIFAKAMNCPEASEGEPCGECSACLEIAEGRSLDVIEIDGASNNSVEDVRTLRENVRIAPARLKYKVYIIDEVHMLSTAAFNAFLKTLEEPPEHVKFIFATTEAHKIPTTILSRCQRFDFRRLTSRQIFKRMKEIADAEAIQIEEGALFAIARAAEGSMRDAQGILDQLVAFSAGEIKLSDIHAMLGTVGQEVYCQIAVAISKGDSFSILKTIDEVVDRGKDLAQFLRELTLYFRNLLVVGFGGGEELVDIPEDDLSSLKEGASGFKQPDLIKTVQDLSDLESRFRQLPSARVAIEMLLLRLARVGADISIDSLLSKLTALEKGLKGSGTDSTTSNENRRDVSGGKGPGIAESSQDNYAPTRQEADDESPEESEPLAPSVDEEGEPQLDLWRQFLNEVRDHSMSIYSYLSVGRFCGVENGQAIVCFGPQKSYNKNHLERKEVRQFLEKTLKTLAGAPLKMKLIIESEDVPPPPLPDEVPASDLVEPETKKDKLLEEAMSNSVVKKTVELFKGKIVYVSG